MNKSELIRKLAERTGITYGAADDVVNGVFDIVTETLAAGEQVQLMGFGTFEVREHAARQGRNPATGEAIPIPDSKSPGFRPGKTLRNALK